MVYGMSLEAVRINEAVVNEVVRDREETANASLVLQGN
jgi:hypothetical protein